MNIDIYSKTIAAAATPESLAASSPKYTQARVIQIHCPASNTSDLTLIASSRGGTDGITITKGTSLTLPAPNGAGQSSRYRVTDFLIKAGTNGDKVEIALLDAQP